MMAMLFASKVILGKIEFKDVPRLLKPQVKEILEEKTGIPVDHQRLIFMGRVLNNEKTLEECNVKDRCVLSLVKITVMICSI